MKQENVTLLLKSAVFAAATAIGCSVGADAPFLVGFILFFLMYLVAFLLGFPWIKKQTKSQPRTMLDSVQDVGGRLIVKGYRKISAQYGCAPTAKTTDQKIIEIYTKVGTAFHEAEQKRGEHIPALYLNTIVLHYLQLCEMLGEHHLQSHLQYDVNKYLAEGLREDFKKELNLFDENSNDPDVKRLKDLQAKTKVRLGTLPVNKAQFTNSLARNSAALQRIISYAKESAIKQGDDKALKVLSQLEAGIPEAAATMDHTDDTPIVAKQSKRHFDDDGESAPQPYIMSQPDDSYKAGVYDTVRGLFWFFFWVLFVPALIGLLVFPYFSH